MEAPSPPLTLDVLVREINIIVHNNEGSIFVLEGHVVSGALTYQGHTLLANPRGHLLVGAGGLVECGKQDSYVKFMQMLNSTE